MPGSGPIILGASSTPRARTFRGRRRGPSDVVIDGPMSFADAFADVLHVVGTARAPTAAWKTLCIRQRRRLGTKISDDLATIELDDDVARVRAVVRDLSSGEKDFDTL